jgi:hypothetical protein
VGGWVSSNVMRSSFAPEHWEKRAEEARAVAELLKDPAARIEMLLIAEGYGRLAQHARNHSDAAENSN